MLCVGVGQKASSVAQAAGGTKAVVSDAVKQAIGKAANATRGDGANDAPKAKYDNSQVQLPGDITLCASCLCVHVMPASPAYYCCTTAVSPIFPGDASGFSI